MACATCQFFLAQSEEQGLCRRYPPTVVVMQPDQSTLSMFPPMLKNGLCGEHKEKTDA
jgi:hypothetical protein